jgi:hypothetical protein
MTWPPTPGTPPALAWQAITDNLSSREWISTATVIAAVRDTGIAEDIARRVLDQAIRRERLDVRNTKTGGVNQQHLRLTGTHRDPGGAIYHQAVAHRGGHEYTGGPIPWDHPDGQHAPCAGCPLCVNGGPA